MYGRGSPEANGRRGSIGLAESRRNRYVYCIYFSRYISLRLHLLLTVTASRRGSSPRVRVPWPRPPTTSTQPRAPASAEDRGSTRTQILSGLPRRRGGSAWGARRWLRPRPGGEAPVWRARTRWTTGELRGSGTATANIRPRCRRGLECRGGHRSSWPGKRTGGGAPRASTTTGARAPSPATCAAPPPSRPASAGRPRSTWTWSDEDHTATPRTPPCSDSGRAASADEVNISVTQKYRG